MSIYLFNQYSSDKIPNNKKISSLDELILYGNKATVRLSQPCSDINDRYGAIMFTLSMQKESELMASGKIDTPEKYIKQELKSDIKKNEKALIEKYNQKIQVLDVGNPDDNDELIKYALYLAFVYKQLDNHYEAGKYIEFATSLLEGRFIEEARRIEQNEFAPLGHVPIGSAGIGTCLFVIFSQNGQIGGFHLDVSTDPASLSAELKKLPAGDVGIQLIGAQCYDKRHNELREIAYKNLNTLFNILNQDDTHNYIVLSTNILDQVAGQGGHGLAACAFPDPNGGIHFTLERGTPYFEQNSDSAYQERTIRQFVANCLVLVNGGITLENNLDYHRPLKKPYFITHQPYQLTEKEIAHFESMIKNMIESTGFPDETRLRETAASPDIIMIAEAVVLVKKRILAQKTVKSLEKNKETIPTINPFNGTFFSHQPDFIPCPQEETSLHRLRSHSI